MLLNLQFPSLFAQDLFVFSRSQVWCSSSREEKNSWLRFVPLPPPSVRYFLHLWFDGVGSCMWFNWMWENVYKNDVWKEENRSQKAKSKCKGIHFNSEYREKEQIKMKGISWKMERMHLNLTFFCWNEMELRFPSFIPEVVNEQLSVQYHSFFSKWLPEIESKGQKDGGKETNLFARSLSFIFYPFHFFEFVLFAPIDLKELREKN